MRQCSKCFTNVQGNEPECPNCGASMIKEHSSGDSHQSGYMAGEVKRHSPPSDTFPQSQTQ